jgi:hypothetical protein
MRFALRVTLLAFAFLIGTAILGWWAVPLFAAVAAVVARTVGHQAGAAALAAMVAWGALLTWSATHGSVWAFSRLAGGAMGMSGAAMILATLIFPAALAWTATVVSQFLSRGKAVTN